MQQQEQKQAKLDLERKKAERAEELRQGAGSLAKVGGAKAPVDASPRGGRRNAKPSPNQSVRANLDWPPPCFVR